MLRHLFLLFALLVLPAPLFAQVVSAADPRAAAAGREILAQGGSATDAAMAMMLALTVVEPQSSGIGGGGFLLHHDVKAGTLDTLDGRETAPAAATPTRFLGPDGKPLSFREAFPGGLSVGVPGNIALMAQAHGRWGRLRWNQLFQPAIRLAEGGFAATPRLANSLNQLAPLWRDSPGARAIYWREGRPVRVGETVRNPALAATLRSIARRGPRAFYRGAIARQISRAVATAPRNPAQLSPADLRAYQAKERAPVCMRYRAHRLCGMGPPSSGATTVFGILGMLERFDLRALGPDDPRSWHLIAEAMRLAYADRELYIGDPGFVAVPVAGLLDRSYLAERSRLISPDRTLGRYPPGTPPGAAPRTAARDGEVPGTTHFVAVDRAGNVANMTSTIEGPFGSQLIAGGFFLNNELTDFSFAPVKDGAAVANAVAPGKRPRSSMSPTIVYDAAGRPVLAVGSAGGPRIIMHVLKTLVGVLDWGLSAERAVALPNIFFGGNGLLVERNTSLAAMAPRLTALGHTVVVTELPSKLNAAQRTAQGWRGAADPRSEGESLMVE